MHDIKWAVLSQITTDSDRGQGVRRVRFTSHVDGGGANGGHLRKAVDKTRFNAPLRINDMNGVSIADQPGCEVQHMARYAAICRLYDKRNSKSHPMSRIGD